MDDGGQHYGREARALTDRGDDPHLRRFGEQVLTGAVLDWGKVEEGPEVVKGSARCLDHRLLTRIFVVHPGQEREGGVLVGDCFSDRIADGQERGVVCA